MNALVYRLGFRVINSVGRIKPVANVVTAIARAWLRHATLRSILREQQFDGVIDGGANVGEFATIVRQVLPASDLVCVEPHPDCAATLRGHGYRVVEAALWREKGSLTLSQPAPETTSCTVMKQNSNAQPTWKVMAITLRDLEIKGNRILVKLDLQGAELEALQGMGDLWERCAGVLLEVSIGPDATYESLREMLSRRGFFEYSTTNELQMDGRVIEADKLWLRRHRSG